jgi:large subunit ribosomal protein L29
MALFRGAAHQNTARESVSDEVGTMKSEELKKETDEQLRLDLLETEKHLFKLRFQSATDRLETPSEIRKAKKDIARIKTEQRRRELDAVTKLTDVQVAESKALAEQGQSAKDTPFVGRRKAKRTIQRLEKIQAKRASAQLAVKGK